MPYVDLPAHSVSIYQVFGGNALVGGPEALSNTDTGTYVDLANSGGVQMYYGGDPGFGVADIPADQVTDIEMVYLAKRLVTGGPTADDMFDSTEERCETWPAVHSNYIRGPFFSGCNASVPSDDWLWVSEFVSSADWFRLLDPGPLPEGEGRLSPTFSGGPNQLAYAGYVDWTTPLVRVAYIAARIYFGGPPPYLRVYPRDDALGAVSAGRVWPPSRSEQGSSAGRIGPNAYI